MDKKKLEHFQKRLLQLRADILNRSQNLSGLSLNTEDLADESDHAAAVIQQNLALGSRERDRALLIEVERALSKFETGMFGICEDTEEAIDVARLEAQPWARFSVEAAEQRERIAKRYAAA